MRNYVIVALTLLVAAPMAFAGVYTVGGAGGFSQTIPWWGNFSGFPQMRFQTIWLKSQIGEAGTITRLEHQDYSVSSTGGTFTGCLVKLCHTSRSAVTPTFATNYGGKTPVTCFSGTKVVPNVSRLAWWTVMSGSSLFSYNNTDNLLYEVSWTGGFVGPNYINHTSSGQAGRVYAPRATASSGNVNAGYGTLARITIVPTAVEPTSLGRVKSLYE